jgi:hypothetical protein
VLGKFFTSPAFASKKIAGVVKPPPTTQAEKKLHLPLGWWSYCESRLKQMWAIAISFSG